MLSLFNKIVDISQVDILFRYFTRRRFAVSEVASWSSDLWSADLRGADLSGADLRGTSLIKYDRGIYEKVN